MNIDKKTLPASQLELAVEMSWDEFKPFIDKGLEVVGKSVKVTGFRPGKAPYEMVAKEVGEMTILEESARLLVNKKLDEILEQEVKEEFLGQPQVSLTKLAPNNPLEFKIVVDLLPEIKLPDYKNISLSKAEVKIEDKDLAGALDYLREAQVKEAAVIRPVIEGDKVIADIDIFIDHVPMDNGQAKDLAIVMGKDYLVKGFDQNLLGLIAGAEHEFTLHYPEDHFQKNLAGKMVEFKVKIKQVFERIWPNLDDDLAIHFGLKSLEELKTNLRQGLMDEKKHDIEQKQDVEMLEKIIDKTTFGPLPEALVHSEIHQMLSELEENVGRKGGKFADYLASINKTADDLEKDFASDAEKRVKSALIVKEVFKLENLQVSPEEIDEEREKLLANYRGYQKVEEHVRAPEYRHYLANQIANRKAMLKLREYIIK